VVHAFQFSVLQLVLGVYLPHLKMILEMFSFSLNNRVKWDDKKSLATAVR